MPKEKQLTPIMSQYQSIKIQYPDCLLFFRLGDFYELFYEDAQVASGALDIVLTCRHKGSLDEIPMCGVPAHASESYISRLIKKGFRVAICEQMEKSPIKGSKKLVHRDVVRVITPGTLLEETLLESKEHNFLLAAYTQEGQSSFGIAFVDISTGDFFIETCRDYGLSSVLARVQPREILIPESLLDHASIQACWHEWKAKINALPKARFDCGVERLSHFFQVKTIDSFGSFIDEEIAAGGALLDYVLLTQKRHLFNLSRPKKLDRTSFLEMDAFTRKNLEITQTFSGSKQGSLLDTIDYTVTSMGMRLLSLRLSQPLRNIDEIHERLASVRFFVTHTKERALLRETLRSVPDIERAMGRIMGGKNSPKDLGTVRNCLGLLPTLSIIFQDALPKELQEKRATFDNHGPLSNLLSQALCPDLPAALRQGPIIAPGYNPELDTWRHIHENSQVLLADLQEKYIKETKITTLRIRQNSIIGYFIEVGAAASTKVPFDFQLRQSLVSGYRYTTPALQELEQKIISAQEKAYDIELRLMGDLYQVIEAEYAPIKALIQTIAIFDVSAALGELAVLHHYNEPQMTLSNHYLVEGGRHPIVERHTSAHFVKNTCILDDQEPIWVLTGPNMAGKSTFLRQNALIVILAHMGSFVPADRARIGIVDRLFSRVGASDDLARGHSTFMVEMVETATILNQSTHQSFIILDEVGRGTSTFDGLALAWACIEHFAQKAVSRVLFATHYHELAQLQGSQNLGFYTLKITEWDQSVVFFHEVIKGISNRSYGIHVAKLAGMPDHVVHRAEVLLKELELRAQS